jgi:hypothetical protein
MKLAWRVVAGVLVVGLLAAVLAVPRPAEARGRFWGGVAVGAVTGLVVGSLFVPRVYAAPPVVYAPPPVVYQPAPVVVPSPPVVYYPAPVCSSYWVDPYWNGYQWIGGHWRQVCR